MNVIVANGDYASIVLAGGFFLTNVFLAIALPIYFWRHRANYDAKQPVEYLGEYVEVLRNNSLGSVFHHSFFIWRRLFFTLLVFACEGKLFL